MSANPLTLHIRLTKACNADCGYCSSWQASPESRLSPEELEKIVRFILDESRPVLGVEPSHVTAQFIGGEIALVPKAEIGAHIAVIRKMCQERGVSFIYGAQSNLIVSERKAVQLYDQFEGRLGTSIDLSSDIRTVGGDPEKYRLIWKSADHYLRRHRSTPGAVFVLEPDAVQAAEIHLTEAARTGRMLTYRPIFKGGIKDVRLNSGEGIQRAMETLFDRWFLRLPVIVEPFFQLCEARLSEVSGLGRVVSTACAFQSDCTRKSINIEANGDLYVCLEMADAGLVPIGNGLRGEWDMQALSLYASRSDHLHPDCMECPYLRSCRGGCMYEAIAHGHGPHGKSDHCPAWKSLFSRIDTAIFNYGAEHIHAWLHRLATRHENARAAGLAKALWDDAGEVVSAARSVV